MRKLRIKAVETIVYEKEFELDELEEFLDLTLDTDYNGSLEEFVNDLRDEAHSARETWIVDSLERHADVQGQVWTGELIELPIGGSDPDGE